METPNTKKDQEIKDSDQEIVLDEKKQIKILRSDRTIPVKDEDLESLRKKWKAPLEHQPNDESS